MSRNIFSRALLALLTCIVVLSGLLTFPLSEISRYQVMVQQPKLTVLEGAGIDRTIQISRNRQLTGPTTLLLPSHGGIVSATLGTQFLPPGAATKGYKFDRYRRISMFDLPDGAGSSGAAARPLFVTLASDRLPAGFGSVYIAPAPAAVRAVAAMANTSRVVSLAMPIAVQLALLICLALLFFSDMPQRYGFIIGTFVCSLIIENDLGLSIGACLWRCSSHTMELC